MVFKISSLPRSVLLQLHVFTHMDVCTVARVYFVVVVVSCFEAGGKQYGQIKISLVLHFLPAVGDHSC